MKSVSLAVVLTFISTSILFAQDKRQYRPIPEEIIGEWKVSQPKEESKFESITFYAGGLLNVDTNGTKMVLNYKVSETTKGYEVFISGMEHTSPFSSFFITSVEGRNMLIALKNHNSSKTVALIKAKDIPFGVIPLQAKNDKVL